MVNLTLNTDTQRELVGHLAVTEKLLSAVASEVSGRPCSATVIALPDLGLPLNMTRIAGGFFTGALYAWDTDVPFVPIDGTVNSCGVSLFKINRGFKDSAEFDATIEASQAQMCKQGIYNWNFAIGNHLITYGCIEGSTSLPDGYYLAPHSSALEHKYGYWGLYPEAGNWYWDQVKTMSFPEEGRSMRYVDGTVAETFFSIAKKLEYSNRDRHYYIAKNIAGVHEIEEVLYAPHYGLPSINALAIGCNWSHHGDRYVLLTAPGEPLYVVENDTALERPNQLDGLVISPHGLGLSARSSPFKIDYDLEAGVVFNASPHTTTASFQQGVDTCITRVGPIAQHVSQILERCPGRVVATLKPRYSYA